MYAILRMTQVLNLHYMSETAFRTFWGPGVKMFENPSIVAAKGVKRSKVTLNLLQDRLQFEVHVS